MRPIDPIGCHRRAFSAGEHHVSCAESIPAFAFPPLGERETCLCLLDHALKLPHYDDPDHDLPSAPQTCTTVEITTMELLKDQGETAMRLSQWKIVCEP